MIQPANLNLFELLNYCLERHPDALGIFALNPRIASVRFSKRPRKPGGCYHRPSGKGSAAIVRAVSVVGVSESVLPDAACPQCREVHAQAERCAVCGQMIPWHDFPGRQLRDALVTVELPGPVGVNLRGPEADRAFVVAFSIDRAVYDEYLRRINSPIILPEGMQI